MLEFLPGGRVTTRVANKNPTGRPMNRSTEQRLREVIEHPPEGSDLAAAKAFGVDLYSVLENLKLSPAERCRRADEERIFVQQLREARRKRD